MTGKDSEKEHVESAEKQNAGSDKDSVKAANEAGRSISDIGRKVQAHRKQQHESGKSGVTDQHGLNSAKDILGDFAHGEKRKDSSKPKLESDQLVGKAKEGHQPSKFETATQTLLESACQRFGRDKIEAMHIKKDDMSTAVSALLLGPDLCKAMGPQETSNFGKRLIVFGIAPAFGMSDEAQKQFSKENLQNTAHEASSNFMWGSALGAVLERAHPAVMSGAILGAGAWFMSDQTNNPEHKARNAELARIASKVDSAGNEDLAHMAGQTRKLIGPDAYKGVFVVATGGAGIPEGQALKAGLREETAHAASKIDLKVLADNIKHMGKDALESINSIFKDHPQARPATAGAAPLDWIHPMSSAKRAELPGAKLNDATTLKMEGKGDRVPHPDKPLPKAEAPSPEKIQAQKILNSLEAIEKDLTRELLDLAGKNGGEMIGLKHKFKSLESLERKIQDEGVEKINDALRYTTTFAPEKLAAGANQMMNALEHMGYKKIAVKNTFAEDNVYMGINTTFMKDGHKFELQFHTPESFGVKDGPNHKLYEVRRELFTKDASGQTQFKSPAELAKVAEKYLHFLDENYTHLADLGKAVMKGAEHAEGFAEELLEQMRKNSNTIKIPSSIGDVKNLKIQGK